MFRDTKVTSKMNETEKATWVSFRNVAQNFLGNNKIPDYLNIVRKMVENLQKMGCLMNLKLQFLDSHLDYFPENLENYSDEQGERFHQDLKEMERRYQGRWDLIANYFWMLQRETVNKGKKRTRKQLHRTFDDKRERYKCSD